MMASEKQPRLISIFILLPCQQVVGGGGGGRGLITIANALLPFIVFLVNVGNIFPIRLTHPPLWGGGRGGGGSDNNSCTQIVLPQNSSQTMFSPSFAHEARTRNKMYTPISGEKSSYLLTFLTGRPILLKQWLSVGITYVSPVRK